GGARRGPSICRAGATACEAAAAGELTRWHSPRIRRASTCGGRLTRTGQRPRPNRLTLYTRPMSPHLDDRPSTLATIEDIQETFRGLNYITDRSLATATFLALELGRPLLLEGEAGVGKTELAKVLAASLGARLIRLQCYEGLDVNTAVYEWNYPRQMLEIRLL